MNIQDKIDDHPITSGQELKDDTLLSQARNQFIKKVYSILGIQLTVTTAFVIFNMNSPAFAQFQLQNQAVFWVALAVSLVSLIVLICVSGMATKSPWNVLLLSLFTLAESYMVSMICSFYTPESVLNAAIATLGATIGLTLYAVKTKTDFSDSYSKCYGFLWSFLFVSMFLIVLNLFFIQSQGLGILIAVAFSALYAFYLIIDTQLIMGGRRNELTLDNYILGAMLLYIDIIQLFLNLLRILGQRN